MYIVSRSIKLIHISSEQAKQRRLHIEGFVAEDECREQPQNGIKQFNSGITKADMLFTFATFSSRII